MTDTKNTTTAADPEASVAPQLVSQIGDAPGQGILPNISSRPTFPTYSTSWRTPSTSISSPPDGKTGSTGPPPI